MSEEESTYLKRLKELLSKDRNSRLFLSLAEEYWKRDVRDVAIGILEEGLKNHPDFTAARYCLASWYLSKDRPVDAEMQLSAIVEENPSNLSACLLLARLHRRLGRAEQAVAGYRHILSLSAGDPEARKALDEMSPQAAPEVKPVTREQAGHDAASASAALPDPALLSEAENAFLKGDHALAIELYTSMLPESPEFRQVVLRRDEARDLVQRAQRERKRHAAERLGRLKSAVMCRYEQKPSPGSPPAPD